MAEIPESNVVPPPTLEQRMEKLEGNFGQILGLLKTLIPDKEIANDNSNNNDNGGRARMVNKMEMLEEKMRTLQGIDIYGRLDMRDFFLFPNMEIPAKFEVPDFEKFEGKTDLVIHLTMYTRSMAAYHNNEKLMIHCFQHSLAGGALTWFLHLDKNQIKSWRSLVELFAKQCQFVTDIAPDRFELQRIRKAEKETFGEYAQRWREKVSR
ncbi:Retrotransposon gag domain [Sesbania bispinosa]|nr:Retrotransposon gag domain [Sesbania bispinosa]